VTPQQAARELIRRRAARRSLVEYARFIDVPGAPLVEDDDCENFIPVDTQLAAHHEIILNATERCIMRHRGRTMLFLPPGSAKSTYATVVAPTHFMGKIPNFKVIGLSYGSDLARKFGRRMRSITKQRKFELLFNTRLSTESSAADEWALTNGSEYMGGGILSGVTGNRADFIPIDDPIKGRRDADSDAVRRSTKDAYDDDVLTRLKPSGSLMITQTRWNADDLAGSILPENWVGESGMIECRDGEIWEVICIPAQCENRDDPLGRKIGEYIWPEYFGEDHWTPFKRNARTWSALFQQRPSPDEGTFFKKTWFNRFDTMPDNLNYYMTSDHAPGGEQDNDYNVFRVWGIDHNQHIWMVDGYRVQGTIDKAMGVALSTSGDMALALEGALPLIKKWRPFCWFPEDDNNWKAVKPFVVAAMRKTGTQCRIEAISPHGSDKATKAQPFQAKAAMGEVHIKEGTDGDSVIEQYGKFPAGKYDDEVDAAANIGRALDMAHPALIPAPRPNETRPKDYRPRSRQQDVGFWA
jgi:hypothetical protein